MNKSETRELIRRLIEEENREQLFHFINLNPRGGHYAIEQKEYALRKALSIGVRVTSRLFGGKNGERNSGSSAECRHLKKNSLF